MRTTLKLSLWGFILTLIGYGLVLYGVKEGNYVLAFLGALWLDLDFEINGVKIL